MRVLLVVLLVAGALALGFVLGRGGGDPAPRRGEPVRIVEREVVAVPASAARGIAYELRDPGSVLGFLRELQDAPPDRKLELMEYWRRNGAKEESSGTTLLSLLRAESDPALRILIGDLAAECTSLTLSAEAVDEVLGLLRDADEPELRYAAARLSRSVWGLEEGKDKRIYAWLPIALERIESDEDIRVVIGLADLVGDHYGSSDEIVAALRARADGLPAGPDHRALRLALAKDDVRMRYETVDGERVLLPTPRWEHYYAQWERARSDELREDYAQVIGEFLPTFSTRDGVDDEQAKAILEQVATVYGRTTRKETRIGLVGALWKEQGGRFRAGALDTLIAIEPDAELRGRMETLRKKIRWGQIADLDDVLAALQGE